VAASPPHARAISSSLSSPPRMAGGGGASPHTRACSAANR
jgi:hypothetical protein